jgi:site-specific recombinase XerD
LSTGCKTANKNGAGISINVHPHVFRHSKAVHLLESGVELIYIRDILGHSSVTTTEIYAKVCTANKRAALEKAYENVADQSDEDWSDNKDLMSWLGSLSKKA